MNDGSPDELAALGHETDLVRLGLAGNLRSFTFTTSTGERCAATRSTTGAPAGYADSPEEIISYVDAHDNETLFDLLTFKLPADTSMADRVRMNNVSRHDGPLADAFAVARGHRPAALQVARPQQLRLG
ncbi:hypothetical protein NKG05_04370 [Oerskovia sp. M15]